MSQYIDGFILPVPRNRIEEYRRVAEAASDIWKEHGALEYCECAGDDLQIDGTRSFRDLVAATDDETVVFAWVVYGSREARDAANEKIAADPRMAELIDPSGPIPDFKRMAFGGFRSLVRSTISNSNPE